jgi:hypothetical protein
MIKIIRTNKHLVPLLQGVIHMVVKKKTAKKKAKKKVVKKVRCAGKTKDGKMCKRFATPPSKFCYLHKKKK